MAVFNPTYQPTSIYEPSYNTQMRQMLNPYMMNQTPQMNNSNTGFIWVQGEAAAKAYPVAAGNTVLLMDSESQVLYIKSTDATGKPLPMETYDLVKREDPVASEEKETVEYVSKDEVMRMISEAVKKENKNYNKHNPQKKEDK